MGSDNFLISVPRQCVGKKTSRSMLFDQTPEHLEWVVPDSRVSHPSLMSYDLVLDPLYKLREKCPEIMWTNDVLLVSTSTPQLVYRYYEPYDSYEIALNVSSVSEQSRTLKPKLNSNFEAILSQVVDYCQVSICVTSNFMLHVYGTERNVAYAKYKLFVVLNHQYGYAIAKLDLPLSMQPSVAGHKRQNLLTVFQQTSVNVYMPPLLKAPVDEVEVNEVYLAGDKVKLVIAEKLLNDVVIKHTETLVSTCVLSAFVRDTLLLHCTDDLEEIMLNHATFIQFPDLGTEDVHTVRVQGTTRKSISNTIQDIMKLCGKVYCVEMRAHLDSSLAAAVAACGVNIKVDPQGTIIYGLNRHIHEAMKTFKLAGSEAIETSVLLEQPLELMDFILGKKMGKIMKVVNGTSTGISVEKYHEYNFRLRLNGNRITNVEDALKLLEAELPAERYLYIPEVYHKQIIGQGGSSVQQIMRKYNVYMRFVNATRDKYPNAFGDSRTDNVLIRCPAKNKYQFDSAAKELLQCVSNLAKNHHVNHIVLTRNHRRLLLGSHSNALRDAEVSSGAAIKLPPNESHETQILEISAQTKGSINNAVDIVKGFLVHTDYEFRIPYTSRLPEIVGANSKFGECVVAPLFLAMNAEVQAFSRVQIMGDNSVYSQIVVSVYEDNDGELFEDISHVITSYLRQYNVDIVDQGKLSAEIRAGDNIPLLTNSNQTAESVSSPARNEPQGNAPQTSSLPTVSFKFDSNVTVPKPVPTGLSTRTAMAPVQYNRNFDHTTPVKKKRTEDSGRNLGDISRQKVVTPKVKMTHFQR